MKYGSQWWMMFGQADFCTKSTFTGLSEQPPCLSKSRLHFCSAWSSIRESQSRKGRQRRGYLYETSGDWKTKAESRDSWLSNLGLSHCPSDSPRWSLAFISIATNHSFFKKSSFFNLNLFLAGLGLHCCARAFSCGRRGLLCSCGSWASHCSVFFCRAPAAGNVGFSTFISGSVVLCPGRLEPRFGSRGTQT